MMPRNAGTAQVGTCDASVAGLRQALAAVTIADASDRPRAVFGPMMRALHRLSETTPPADWLVLWSDVTRCVDECSAWVEWEACRDTSSRRAARRVVSWEAWYAGVWTPADLVLTRRAVLARDVPDVLADTIASWRQDIDALDEASASDDGPAPGADPVVDSLLGDVENGDAGEVADGAGAEAADAEARIAEAVCAYRAALSGATCVTPRGIVPLGDIWPELLGAPRDVRAAAQRSVINSAVALVPTLDPVWRKLHRDRCLVAAQDGHQTVLDAYYEEQGRTGMFSMADARALAVWARTQVAPIYRAIRTRRAAALALPALAPWDLWVAPVLAPPGTRDGGQLWREVRALFQRMHPAWDAPIAAADAAGCVSIATDGRQVIGWQCAYGPSRRLSYILGRPSGATDDLTILAHECGHAVHAALADVHGYVWLADVGSDIAEMVAIGVEALSLETLRVAALKGDSATRPAVDDGSQGSHPLARWDDEGACAAVAGEWIWNCLRSVLRQVADDLWQQWLWRQAPGSVSLRRAAVEFARVERWLGLVDEHLPIDEDAALADLVQQRSHVWESPGYALEYAIAQLAALTVLARSRDDLPGMVEQWTVLMREGAVGLDEACELADVPWVFSDDGRRDVVEVLLSIQEEVDDLWMRPGERRWSVDVRAWLRSCARRWVGASEPWRRRLRAAVGWSPRSRRSESVALGAELERWVSGSSSLFPLHPTISSSPHA